MLLMSEFRRSRGGEETDLLCVEVSALGSPSALPRVSCEPWQELPSPRTMSKADHAHEDFLRSLLLKTDAYRPRQASLPCMENLGETGGAQHAADCCCI